MSARVFPGIFMAASRVSSPEFSNRNRALWALCELRGQGTASAVTSGLGVSIDARVSA